MPFRVAARTILELGSELISSDAIALYELIKNSVDAGSSWISIRVQIVLGHSHYLEALEALDDDLDPSIVRAQVLRSLEDDAPPRARHSFSRMLSRDDTPQEFRDSLQQAYHDHNWIEVKDRGHGMDREELDDVFLTIGTRSRRGEKVADDGQFADPGRTLLGDKGVGRLSAMRLGEHMVVTTSRAGNRRESILDVDWRAFSHESAQLIEEVDISPKRGAPKERPSDHGTSILIRDLRADWDRDLFERMVERQFKRIIDPFPASPNIPPQDPNDLFRLRYNGKRHYVPQIPSWLLEEAHAVVSASFEAPHDAQPRLLGEINYRLRAREKQFEQGETELMSIVDPIADRTIRAGPRTLRNLGSFTATFYWFNRLILREIPGIGKRADIIAAVNSWAGGLMVFRDGFRINPYGGQDDDWLELDKKALAARSYKVNRSQIIGYVRLTSANFHLIEQTNREGLVDNQYKQVLVGLLRHILISEFRTFITNVDKERKIIDDTTTDDLEQRIDETTYKIESTIHKLRHAAPDHEPDFQQLLRLTMELGRFIDEAKAMAKEYEDDRSKFVHLAGIGLMIEFILHEIGRTATRALSALGEIDTTDLTSSDTAALATLSDQLITLQKRVQTLDPVSTSRRQTKSTFDVREVVDQVIDGRHQQLVRHGVDVRRDLPNGQYKIRAVKGMLIQILENLLDNSLYWLKVQARRERSFMPQIDVSLNRRSRQLVFRDNGPGVAASRSEEIFEPFVTAKPPGQGRGLGLHISRELANYHDWHLYLSIDNVDESGRSSSFVLDM